jgi:hypothetical protein
MSLRTAWRKALIGGIAAAGILGCFNSFAQADHNPNHGYGGPGQHVAQAAAPTVASAYRHPILASNSDEDVGVVLVLALDASGSMSNEEWRLQTRATAQALTSELVQNAIRCKSGNPSIAIAVVEFDDTANLRIPFVDLRAKSCTGDDPEFENKIQLLAAEIAELPRWKTGSTGVGNMLKYTVDIFANSPWLPEERRVLDVSGDGSNNTGIHPEPGRKALMEAGVTINGLAIVNDEDDLDKYYSNYLISNDIVRSPDGRTMSVPGRVWAVARNMKSSNNDFGQMQAFGEEVTYALKSKISMELAGIYEKEDLLDQINQNRFAEYKKSNKSCTESLQARAGNNCDYGPYKWPQAPSKPDPAPRKVPSAALLRP